MIVYLDPDDYTAEVDKKKRINKEILNPRI